jgi:hypothetical protein
MPKDSPRKESALKPLNAIRFAEAKCASSLEAKNLFDQDLLGLNLMDETDFADYVSQSYKAGKPYTRRSLKIVQKALEVEAISVCGSCKHESDCLEEALAVDVFGVAGGLTANERAALRLSRGSKSNEASMDYQEDRNFAHRLQDDEYLEQLNPKKIRTDAEICEISYRHASRLYAKAIVLRRGLKDKKYIHDLHEISVIRTDKNVFFKAFKSTQLKTVQPVGKITIPKNILPLNQGKSIQFPERCNIVSSKIHDVLTGGESISRESMINKMSKVIPDENGLYSWSIRFSTLLVSDDEKQIRRDNTGENTIIQAGDVRVMSSGGASFTKSERILEGKKLLAKDILNKALRSGSITEEDGMICGTRRGIQSWVDFRELMKKTD